MSEISITIMKNGVEHTLVGQLEAVARAAKEMGVVVAMYNSSSRGPTVISSMATPHIQNAIQALFREWLSSRCANVVEPGEFVTRLTGGPTEDLAWERNDEVRALLAELISRL